MLNAFLVPLSMMLFGAVLAIPIPELPLRPGWVGAAILVAMAFWLRRRWRSDADAPEAPERGRLLSLAGTSAVMGHLAMALWQIGPNMDMHSAVSHSMAVDSWTLFFASLVMWQLAQVPGGIQDERDRAIAARALRDAYYALVAMMMALALWIGFGSGPVLEQLSRAMLAQLLICGWIISCMVNDISCLLAYGRAHRLAAQA